MLPFRFILPLFFCVGLNANGVKYLSGWPLLALVGWFFLHGVVRVGGVLRLLECCEGMISHLLAESLKWYAVMGSVLPVFFFQFVKPDIH